VTHACRVRHCSLSAMRCGRATIPGDASRGPVARRALCRPRPVERSHTRGSAPGTRVGRGLDTYLKTKPPESLREIVRALELILDIGDRRAGLL
jgi:hypothetical protein